MSLVKLRLLQSAAILPSGAPCVAADFPVEGDVDFLLV